MENEEEKTVSAKRKNSDSSEANVIGLNRGNESSTSAGLETIQNILFGEQVRSNNEQIEALKAESSRSLQQLSGRIDQRLDDLTESMNSQFAALNQQLDAQKTAQQSSDERMDLELDACKAAFTQSIATTRDDLNARLSQALSEMQDAKLDRGKLSELFAHVAQELIAPATTQAKS